MAVSDSTVRVGLQAHTVRKAEPLTRLWRSASAMGVKHAALVVVAVANLLAVAAPITALELGELQAVPGNHPLPVSSRHRLIARRRLRHPGGDGVSTA